MSNTQRRVVRIIDDGTLVSIHRRVQWSWCLMWRGKVDELHAFLTDPSIDIFTGKHGAASPDLDDCDQYVVTWIRDDNCQGLRYEVAGRYCVRRGPYPYTVEIAPKVFESLPDAVSEALAIINSWPSKHQEYMVKLLETKTSNSLWGMWLRFIRSSTK